MLVLSRKEGEQIIVDLGGRTIVIRIIDCRGGKTRLGVTAPPDVTVHREEVWKRLSEWNDSEIALSTAASKKRA